MLAEIPVLLVDVRPHAGDGQFVVFVFEKGHDLLHGPQRESDEFLHVLAPVQPIARLPDSIRGAAPGSAPFTLQLVDELRQLAVQRLEALDLEDPQAGREKRLELPVRVFSLHWFSGEAMASVLAPIARATNSFMSSRLCSRSLVCQIPSVAPLRALLPSRCSL